MEIDWLKEYKREFSCPKCGQQGLKLATVYRGKRRFKCSNCRSVTLCCNDIKIIKSNVNWRQDYKIGEFACPNSNCHARDMRLAGYTDVSKKKRVFKCGVCGAMTSQCIDLNRIHLSKFVPDFLEIKPFNFAEDKWELNNQINPSYNSRDNGQAIANFENIKCDWFKNLVKHYIEFLLKQNTPLGTIQICLSYLRAFSEYLVSKNITSLSLINRLIILDYINWKNTSNEVIRQRLKALKKIFLFINTQGWSQIDQDIIRNEDFPKKKHTQTRPIPDTVREQIEANLHILPDPIARMWLISFFTAIRPGELAFLKKNCLVQEGEYWKVVFERKKTKDYHEIPITRTIAKIIQQQQSYIDEIWGTNWDYLFCHYQNLSTKDPTQPNIKPVRKLISKNHSGLKIAICCLIKALNIKDDNGKLAQFSPCLIRHSRLTQLFEQGHDLAVVSAWAGHKSLATTSTYYTYISCELIQKEAGDIQKILVNSNGQYLSYESLPSSFLMNSRAHQLDLSSDHINTPIYGYCSLPLDQECHKFRACYTCRCFVATSEKLSLYIRTRDELRAKQSRAREAGQDVLVEQFGSQADQLDKIIISLEKHHEQGKYEEHEN